MNEYDLTPEGLEAFVAARRNYTTNVGLGWGHFYQLSADSVVLENRPEYMKFYSQGMRAFWPDYSSRFYERIASDQRPSSDPGNAVQLTMASLQHLPMYIEMGWETGIYNEFRHLQSRGLSKAQLIEMVLFCQLSVGIRGLQHVYNAVGKMLPDWRDGPGPAPLPEGWAPDPDAFRCGLDLSTQELTDADRQNIVAWYERTIGYVPNSVNFAMKYHPDFLKWQRARWEIIFQELPKQVAPFIMIRQHIITGFRDALREAVLLGKAWGITKYWTIYGITTSAWYTGLEGLYAAHDALDDILSDPGW